MKPGWLKRPYFSKRRSRGELTTLSRSAVPKPWFASQSQNAPLSPDQRFQITRPLMSSWLSVTQRPWKSIPGNGSKPTSLKSLYFQLGATGRCAQPAPRRMTSSEARATIRRGVSRSPCAPPPAPPRHVSRLRRQESSPPPASGRGALVNAPPWVTSGPGSGDLDEPEERHLADAGPARGGDRVGQGGGHGGGRRFADAGRYGVVGRVVRVGAVRFPVWRHDDDIDLRRLVEA